MFACLFAVSFQFAPFNAAVKWLNISTTCRLRTRLARRGREGGAHAGEDIGQVGKGIGHVGQAGVVWEGERGNVHVKRGIVDVGEGTGHVVKGIGHVGKVIGHVEKGTGRVGGKRVSVT